MTGDKEQVDHDLSIGGLSLTRTYHSQSTHIGRFGYGWTWDYGWQMELPVSGQVKIRRPDGKQMVFNDNGTGTYIRRVERTDEMVVPVAGGFRYTRHDRSTVDFDASGRVTSINSEDGRAITVAYDASGNPVFVTDPFGRSISIATDPYGHITSIAGPLGRIWAYAYDANGNLVSVTYPDAASRQYVYNDANDVHNLTQIIDEAGRVYANYGYDVHDHATLSAHPLSGYQDTVAYNADGTVSVTESDGRVVNYTVSEVNGIPNVASRSDCGCGAAANFTYDPYTGVMLTSTDKLGVSTSYTYDGNGRTLTKTEAVGTALARTTSFTYDAYGHVTSTTDPLGNVTSHSYDGYGHVVSTTGPLGNVTTNAWNTDGTLASRTDALGNTTGFTYDVYGQVIAVTNPDSTSRSMTYDMVGRIISLTDEAGATTAYTYDSRDRVLSVTYADGTTVTNAYDISGDLVSSTDVAGLTTTFTYDVEHRPLTMTRPDGSVVTSTFNAKGNLTARDVKDAAGVTALTESMSYDADGRLLSTTHADTTSTSNTYDMVGRLLTSTDEAGRVITNSYDELGRLVSTTNANNEVVTYAYDASDHLIRATAANGVTSTFAFDAAGRLTQEVSADRGTTGYSYDAAGNLLSKTDGNGIVSNYAYDAMHRLTSIGYSSDATLNTAFTYDAGGRMLSMSDAGGTTSYSYDIVGHLTSANWTPAGAAFSLNLAYAYDAAGRVASVTYPSGHKVAYTYGTDGRLTDMTGHWLHPNGKTKVMPLLTGVSYNALGEVTGRSFGNGITESRSYDNRGRLASLTAAGVLDRALTWAPESNISAIGSSDPYANQSFGYDASDRLTSASGSYGTLAYTYDTNGNRTSRTDGIGTQTSEYAAGTNQLIRNRTPGKRFEYDAAGNQVRRGGKLFAYGVNNRVAQVTKRLDGTLKGSYLYNGKGERVRRTVYPALNPPRTFLYVYDPAGNLIGEYDELGNLRSEYVYGPTGRLATLKRWYGGTKWHHNDHLGTPAAMTDKLGTTVWTMSQTPFGIATVNEDPDGDGINVTNNFRFPGQYFDAETGLNYNYYRTYDPANGGRYTQSDPIGLNGGMNTFTYVEGNPVNAIDPLGLYQCTYSISEHTMVCSPNNIGHPNYSSSNYVSGNNNILGPIQGDMQNNSQYSDVPFHGPIPVGEYEIRPQRPNSLRRDLVPVAENNMNGRDAFQIHGCSNPDTCSDGCIAATRNSTRDTFNNLMHLEEGNNTLTVVP